MADEIPKAVREATAFSGLVDAYELADKQIVLSSRGAIAGITGGTDQGAIQRYARGIAKENGGAELPVVEFTLPRGGRAKGITLDTFVTLVEWWSEQLYAGELTENQEHIGVNCARMQGAAARLGWEALARSWFGETIPSQDVPIMYAKWLRDNAATYERFYLWELPEALRPLIAGASRKELSHKQWPVWMKGIHEWLYDAVFGKLLADKAREARNSTGAKTITQVLADETKKTLASYMPTFVGLARSASSIDQWKSMVLNVLGVKAPTQTGFPFDGEAA
jgi:hypothetical protein